jgi:leucyl/phenylalanyl-tRNA---protein transferase
MVMMGYAKDFEFPSADTADEMGLLAITDRLTPELVLKAYQHGIFPWSTDPVCWFSPDPRAVFERSDIHLPTNLGKIARKAQFEIRFDTAFVEVMRACSEAHRADGVWISEEFIQTYGALHEEGYAHSVEVWQGDKLVGGLYGVQIGGFFSGESMFYLVSNASKIAFAALVYKLDTLGNVLFDAQAINDHTARLGAVLIRRSDYLRRLQGALRASEGFVAKKWARNP